MATDFSGLFGGILGALTGVKGLESLKGDISGQQDDINKLLYGNTT